MPTCLYANGKCSQCGAAMSVKDRRQCGYVKPARPRNHKPVSTTECRYFLGATEEVVLITGCRTCRGQGGVEATVCACELEAHPRCVVFKRGTPKDKTVQQCHVCQDRTP